MNFQKIKTGIKIKLQSFFFFLKIKKISLILKYSRKKKIKKTNNRKTQIL